MDHTNQEAESRRSGSFGRATSSRRRSLSNAASGRCEDIGESENASEAGDIGDRALYSNWCSASGRSHFSLENLADTGTVVPIQEDTLSQSSFSSDLESISKFSIDMKTTSVEKKSDETEEYLTLKYITCLLALAVFGILGVLTRYGLQKIFGPGEIGVTSDQSILYLDLPSNMVGSFLMGWIGVVFKPDIARISDQLAIGLSTGFLGSLTTFSGWNQKMLDLSVQGQWIFAFLGIFIGFCLVAYSILLGIYTAEGARWLYRRSNTKSYFNIPTCNSNRPASFITFMVMLMLMLGLLWSLFGFLVKQDFENGGSEAQLFFACIVGPFGVWIRWFLARFNGRGLIKWMPVGTLAANVLAACVMAGLATLKKAVNNKHCDTVASGIQFGLLGCLSTVSTFIAEFHEMRKRAQPWRADAYAATTIVVSFILGTAIYTVPVWIAGYS